MNRVPKGEEREYVTETIFLKITMKNFPYQIKDINSQIQAALLIPSRVNIKKTTSRHIRAKRLKIKDKEKPLKATSEKKRHITSRRLTLKKKNCH